MRVSHVVWSLALCCVLWSLQTRAQDAPRQVQFGVGRIEEDVRGTDLLDGFFVLHNVVEDTLKVAAASARAASAGSGAFVELMLEDVGTDPELRFQQVLLNNDGIPIEHEPSTAVVEGSALPNASHLRQNFPNPFNGETVLVFSLAAGLHRVSWNATDGRGRKRASGRYIASMETGDDRQAIGMVFVE